MQLTFNSPCTAHYFMEALLLLDLQLDCITTLETVWKLQQLDHKLTLDPILCRSNMSDSGSSDKRKREGEDEDMPQHEAAPSDSPAKSPEKKRTRSGSEHSLIYTKLYSCNNTIEYN